MSTFASLLKSSKNQNPSTDQKRARAGFPKVVAQSHLSLRRPGKILPGVGRQFIVGIASYSAPELNLLDELENALESSSGGNALIEVFDVGKCKAMGDFQEYIPGIDPVYRTPVIGVFIDGRLIDQATGLSEVIGILRRFHVIDREPSETRSRVALAEKNP